MKKANNQEKTTNYKKHNFAGGNKADYDFSDYRSLLEFFKAIY